MPDLFDVIELIVDLPEHGLRAGMQGTVVHCHSESVCEIEFVNEDGETIALLPLHRDQFIVIWRARTREWVPLSERMAELIARLPEDMALEVLDFARFLHAKRLQKTPSPS
jgi:hypothetical protein